VRRRLWTAAAVLAAGVLVRVAAFGGLDGILPAEGLYVDERVYAEGFGALDGLPFQRPPAMYALAGLMGAGADPARARWVMSALSLLPALALALAMPRRGYWSRLLPLAVALQPDLVVFGLQLLPAVPAAVAVTGALLALARGRRAVAGALMGVACLFRAELLLALPLVALLPPLKPGGRMRLVLPWAAAVVPVMALNLAAGAGPVISVNGPENLWLGSEERTLRTPPGVEFEQLVAVEGRQQQTFLERAADGISARPLDWLLLGLRKSAASLSIPGPGRNLELGYLVGRLRLAPLLAPMLLLVSLGLWRILRGGPAGGEELRMQRALAGAILLSAFLFLPAARYRLAAMPALWMAAAASAPRRDELAGWGCAAVAVLAVSLLVSSPVRKGLTQIQQAEHRIGRGRPRMALESLAGARERGYRGADLHNLAGIALSMSGDGETGLSSFEEGLRLAPRSPTLWKNAAVCLAGMGRREEASAAAARAVRLNRALREELAPLLP